MRGLERSFNIRISGHQPVSGGDIAQSYLLNTSRGDLFVKVLEGSRAYEMLTAEADGLAALQKANALSVPKVYECEKTGSGAALLMEYIKPSGVRDNSHESLGRGLALMHQTTNTAFGWHCDNFIGSLPQINEWELEWATFFGRRRLRIQFDAAVSSGLFEAEKVPHTSHMIQKISDLLPELKPSLLHGDLWGGNYLISENNTPYLIDPAVYFGHSEVDLAMSRLFGGFSPRFYDAYFEICPAQPGLEKRIVLYQLYYLLVHLNLFGPSYRRGVSTASELIFGSD